MKLRAHPQSNKSTDLPAGVSAFIEKGRKPGSSPGIAFGVSFRTEEGLRVIKFRAGVNAEDEDVDHARLTAIAFRKAYEYAVAHGRTFRPEKWKAWREKRLYP